MYHLHIHIWYRKHKYIHSILPIFCHMNLYIIPKAQEKIIKEI